jgi:hypothetical protein
MQQQGHLARSNNALQMAHVTRNIQNNYFDQHSANPSQLQPGARIDSIFGIAPAGHPTQSPLLQSTDLWVTAVHALTRAMSDSWSDVASLTGDAYSTRCACGLAVLPLSGLCY